MRCDSPSRDKLLPFLKRKKIVAIYLVLCWVLFIIPPHFFFPNLPQEKFYLSSSPGQRQDREVSRELTASLGERPARPLAEAVLWTPGLWPQLRWLAGPKPWPRDSVQRPRLCSEQSLFKHSLTGNLALLTHSDSTLLRKKKKEPEPTPARVSHQVLTPSSVLSTMACAPISPPQNPQGSACPPQPTLPAKKGPANPPPLFKTIPYPPSNLPPLQVKGMLRPVSTSLLPIWLAARPYRNPGILSS